MQKGFTTLEIIMGVLITALLMTTTLPNLNRILDRVSLDYETKRLYTNMRFLQSFDRNFTMNHNADFGDTSKSEDKIQLVIVGTNLYYFTKSKTPAGDIKRYYLSNGVTFSQRNGATWLMEFDDMGKIKFLEDGTRKTSYTFYINSRFGKNSVAIDSVGRFKFKRES